MPPLVSVIIPVYNRLVYLAEAIESVLAQSYPTYEIIIVDDGSVVDVVGALTPYSDRVSYVRQDHKGVSAARNLGVRMSQGEYLAFLDSDDIFMASKLEMQITDLSMNPEMALAYSYEYLIDESGKISSKPLRETRIPPLPSGYIARDFLMESFIGTMTVFLRRSVFVEMGGFDESLQYNEDDDLWFRIMLKYPVMCSKYISGARRIHAANMSRDRSMMVYYQLNSIKKYVFTYDSFCIENSAMLVKRINHLFGDYVQWAFANRRIPGWRVFKEYWLVTRKLKKLL